MQLVMLPDGSLIRTSEDIPGAYVVERPLPNAAENVVQTESVTKPQTDFKFDLGG